MMFDACQVCIGLGVVQGAEVTTECGEQGQPFGDLPVRRGDRQRQAIVQAVRELLEEKPFAELSVSTISDRAGVARSGFYFYFDSKYAVLAHILGEVIHELEVLTHYFAPRGVDESPAAFAQRMVGSAAVVYAHNDPVMAACNVARHSDDEIAAGTAHPISDDVPALVRTLTAATAFMLSGDSVFAGPGCEQGRGVRALEVLWHNALWGGR